MPRDTWFDIVIPVQRLNEKVLDSVSSIFTSKYNQYTIIIGLQNDPTTENEQKYYEQLLGLKNINIVDCNKSSCLPKTLNLCLEKCQSKWVVRHDDDDLMHPRRLYEIDELVKMRQNCPTIIGQQIRYFSWDEKMGARYIAAEWCKQKQSDFELKQDLLLMPCFYHPAITLNLEKLRYHYDEKYTYAQDYKLYIDNLEYSQYLGSRTKGTYYRIPNKNISKTKRKEILPDTKRQMQLQFHEKIIIEMWGKIGITVSNEEARMLRINLVTNEDPGATQIIKCNYDNAIDYLNNARRQFKTYYESI